MEKKIWMLQIIKKKKKRLLNIKVIKKIISFVEFCESQKWNKAK